MPVGGNQNNISISLHKD